LERGVLYSRLNKESMAAMAKKMVAVGAKRVYVVAGDPRNRITEVVLIG
jgi:uncharacterized Fe-S radical SAM superfamily protein PflX